VGVLCAQGGGDRFPAADDGRAAQHRAETGILMASPSETTLIVLAAASAAQLIQPGTAQFWQIVTAIGLTVTPLLARLGQIIARRVERRRAAGPGSGSATNRGSSSSAAAASAGWSRTCSPRTASPMSRSTATRSGRPGAAARLPRHVFGNAWRGDALDRLGHRSAPRSS
jgi:monovalent cation:H+ antiporter-2, CPA2 family